MAGKLHVVCIPYPAQGHITPTFKLAKLLHSQGFHITFVNTEYNHRRLLKSHALSSSPVCSPDFCFETIPDGLPTSDGDATQDIPELCDSVSKNCTVPFRKLLLKLNASGAVPPVTCVVSDGVMSFTIDATRELGVPVVIFWTASACGILGYTQYRRLVEEGIVPLKDESYLKNGYLERVIDWIPGMKDICLKELPSFIRTTNKDDIMLNFVINEIERSSKGCATIFNTFDALESEALKALTSYFKNIYSVGPLHMLTDHSSKGDLMSVASNLWREEDCIEWLDKRKEKSVVYVNFGSITTMNKEQMEEFAWGLANSKKPFLWIIRPDIVAGESAMLTTEFFLETRDRGKLAGWCCQEDVLKHPSIGGFLSHMGWNSMLDSVCGGVPLICWPFFAEQHTNCRYACKEWGVGMEMANDVKREEVEKLVVELMDGEKGTEMRKKMAVWKLQAEEAAAHGGSSYQNFERLVQFLRNGAC